MKAKAALANHFCGIVRHLQSSREVQSTTVREAVQHQSIQDDMTLMAEQLKLEWPERFSTRYLQGRIETILLDLATEQIGQETQQRFMGFLDELGQFDERKLCIASVEGVAVANDDSIRFGPFVLRRATQVVLDKINSLTVESLRHTLHTPEEQLSFAREFQRNAESSLAGKVIVEFEIVADAQHAHTVFFQKANMLMDLLQMSTKIAEFCESARVGLCGHPHSGSYSSWVLPLNLGGWTQPNHRTGALGELCLNNGNIFLLRRAGILRLAEALGRQATPLECALLRAAHWFGHATLQEHVGHKTLSLVVCLESILSSSSARAVAEGVALLVGTSPHQRRQVYDLVRAAYSVRNLAVHEGNVAQHFSQQDQFLWAVREFVTVVTNLCDELKTPQTLIQRIDHMRFS